MIEFTHAYKIYPGPTHAIKDVSLKINKGEFVFLTGPSGSGKTTLFRLLSAYDRASSGRVSVMDFDLAKITKKQIPFFRRRIGVVYQEFRLLKHKTIFENVSLPLEIRGDSARAIRARTEEILAEVGLLHKTNETPEHLSGGEQQRVAIARALVHRPGLLVADEHTGNLDPTLSNEIIKLFEKINALGTTVFVATHDYSLVGKYKRRTIEIQNGSMVRAS
ncbi:MAG: cell division ATP-binding protein FtsE [Bdellovibrionales bacterium RBG_16_40_8]|nr:MAG: cell division ATP-binding protein FtsE [Bdellovibrionales bacterium RBG_16_40_8]